MKYIASFKVGDKRIIQNRMKNIKFEIKYWANAVVCCVLGGHPPFQVIQGYIQRLWGKHNIDQVAVLKNGVIVVRFETIINKYEVLHCDIYHLDDKPFIVKE